MKQLINYSSAPILNEHVHQELESTSSDATASISFPTNSTATSATLHFFTPYGLVSISLEISSLFLIYLNLLSPQLKFKRIKY